MIDPGSPADWAQASVMTGVVAALAAVGVWALTREQELSREQHEGLVASSPNPQAVAMTGTR